MSGCQTCGGFGMHHDPIAHDAEPETLAVCCMHKRFVPCRGDAEDCDISMHPADVEHVRAYQLGGTDR